MNINTMAGLYLWAEIKVVCFKSLLTRFASWVYSFWCKREATTPSPENNAHPRFTGGDNIYPSTAITQDLFWQRIFDYDKIFNYDEIPDDLPIVLEPLFETRMTNDTVLWIVQYAHQSLPQNFELYAAQFKVNKARLLAALCIQRCVRKFLKIVRCERSRAIMRCAYLAQLIDGCVVSLRPSTQGGHLNHNAKLIQKHWKIFKFLKNMRKSQKRSVQQTITNTAFPRLGMEDFDGCDCFLPDPENTYEFPLPYARALFSFNLNIQNIAHYNPAWIVRKVFNHETLVVERLDDTYILWQLQDCHQNEGVAGWKIGHNANTVAIFRIMDEELLLLHDAKTGLIRPGWEVVDQHRHAQNVERNASFRELDYLKNGSSLDKTKTTQNSKVQGKLKLMGDRIVTAEEKARARRERKLEVKATLARGEKPKRRRLPIAEQGLTTQEWHEYKAREQEEWYAWYQSRGFKALPQDAKAFLTSSSGTAQWNQIHARAVVCRPDAEKLLAKLNKFLHSLGVPQPLPLNENKIADLITAKEKRRLLHLKQIEAAGNREDPALAARRAWVDRQNHVPRIELRTENSWADDENEELPDLDW